MNDFDLKKYLAENKLLKEETIDEIVFDFEDLVKDAELDEGDF